METSTRESQLSKKTFSDSPVLEVRMNHTESLCTRTVNQPIHKTDELSVSSKHESPRLLPSENVEGDHCIAINCVPICDATPGPEIEVSHYPINQKSILNSSNLNKNCLNSSGIQQSMQSSSGQNCNCACHHTHLHHHHHTIVINGQQANELVGNPVHAAITTRNMRNSPRLSVLKTASCPAWADGAPKQDRPNVSRTLINTNHLQTIYAARESNNFNRNNNTKDCDHAEHSAHCGHQIQQPRNYRYQSAIKSKKSCCGSPSKGMIALLVVLFVVIISLLSGLVYFLVQGKVPETQEPDVSQVSTVLNQTSICGMYPAEYLSISGRTVPNDNFSSNLHPPKNDNRINMTQAARIIGGMPANIQQYPWQASLWVELRGMTCGGSIILNDWVLTAAHCTEPNSDPRLWTAYMGMSNIDKKMEPPAQRSKIIKIIQNPQYINDFSYDYDVSLMKLETPVTFTPTVQPICLPHSTDVFKDGTECYISGWGATTNTGQANAPKILQHAQINIIGDETCTRDDWLSVLVTERMMCAGTHDGSKDACQGDSGGPLSCYDSRRKAWVLAGSVSWGIECGQPKQPGVYTRMTYFVDWIWTEIGKSERWIEDSNPVSSGDGSD